MGNSSGRDKTYSNGHDYLVIDGSANSTDDLLANYGTVAKDNSRVHDEDDDSEDAPIAPQHRALVYRCAFASSLTSVLLGFDVGIM
jgi:hypothetical protein